MKYLRIIKARLRSLSLRRATFSNVVQKEKACLYAGDVPRMKEYGEYVGLSLLLWNRNHIRHNVLNPYPVANETIDRYQSEDVFEHIDYDKLPEVINEIYRVLKKGGLFRLSVPDYQCDVLYKRSLKDDKGEIFFDPGGGGKYRKGKIVDGGHVWFPTYRLVKELLEKTEFKNITFLHYYDEQGNPVTKEIDYSKGHVKRTPDHDVRVKTPYRPMSIVVDCTK